MLVVIVTEKKQNATYSLHHFYKDSIQLPQISNDITGYFTETAKTIYHIYNVVIVSVCQGTRKRPISNCFAGTVLLDDCFP